MPRKPAPPVIRTRRGAPFARGFDSDISALTPRPLSQCWERGRTREGRSIGSSTGGAPLKFRRAHAGRASPKPVSRITERVRQGGTGTWVARIAHGADGTSNRRPPRKGYTIVK